MSPPAPSDPPSPNQREALEAIGHARDLFMEGDVLGTLGELETARGMIQDLIAAGVFRGVVVGEAQADSGPPSPHLGQALDELRAALKALDEGSGDTVRHWVTRALERLSRLIASGSGPPVSQLGEVLEKLERGWGAWTFGDKQEAFKWQRLAMDQLTAIVASEGRRLGACFRHPDFPVSGCSDCEAGCLEILKAQMAKGGPG